jgi:hypothetical protein
MPYVSAFTCPRKSDAPSATCCSLFNLLQWFVPTEPQQSKRQFYPRSTHMHIDFGATDLASHVSPYNTVIVSAQPFHNTSDTCMSVKEKMIRGKSDQSNYERRKLFTLGAGAFDRGSSGSDILSAPENTNSVSLR